MPPDSRFDYVVNILFIRRDKVFKKVLGILVRVLLKRRQVLIRILFFYSDIDECTASSPLCDVNAQCSNALGSYSCRCRLGFSGNGKTCNGL